MTTDTPNTTTEFLFTIPSTNERLSDGARAALQIGAFASRLVLVERTRCNHPDGRAENVAEHSLMLAKVAPELASLLYPDLDESLVARYAIVHDDLEGYVGDTPTDMLSTLNQQTKDEIEAAGLRKLAEEYSHIPSFVKLVSEYEAQQIPEARFVRAVDKLMVLLIHFPNQGAVIRANYTYESFLQCEQDLLERDSYKYGEFEKIMDLRRELGQELADRFLR